MRALHDQSRCRSAKDQYASEEAHAITTTRLPVVITRCAYAQGRVKRLSPSIYMCNVCCVCVGKKHGCLLSYRSKIATK